jgi:hypothetical protein
MICVALWALCCIVLLADTGTPETLSTISGTVTAEDTGAGLSEIVVQAKPGDISTMTNSKGGYILRGLSSGTTYSLSFFREGSLYINEYSSIDVFIPKDKRFVTVDRVLSMGAAVSGKVYAPDGVTPLSEAAVAVTFYDQPDWVEYYKTTRTDEYGGFLILGLPESDKCVIGVALYGHAWMEKTVKTKKGQTRGDVEFVVNWDDITGISGDVKYIEDKKPVMNERVVLRDKSGRTSGIVFTNNKGGYSIVGAKPGVYDAAVRHQKNYIIRENIIVESGRSTRVDFLVESSKPEKAGKDTE